MTQEFKNIQACKDYLKETNQKRARFFVNFYGWNSYFTLEPTFATPSGRLKEFPREVEISTRMTKPKVI
jgi:hypothetical protein